MSSKPQSPVFKASTKKNSIGSLQRPVKANHPIVLSHDIPPGTRMTFVDISHSLATIDVESKHNKFSALIETANEWLQKNYVWRVEACETVVLAFKQEKLNPIDVGATQRLLQPTVHSEIDDLIQLKTLRLWISRRDYVPEMKKHIDLQTIACQTFLPKSCQFYESNIGWQQLDDMVESVNEAIRNRVIDGQLLNVESVDYVANEEWIVDTECPKQKQNTAKQETAIRVYYVSNARPPPDTPTDEIAIFDFLPDVAVASTTPPKFEPFRTLLYKIQEFLEENPEYKFLNCQNRSIRFKSIEELHTHFMVHKHDIGFYLRYIRMVCTKPSEIKIKRASLKLSTNQSVPNQIKSADSSRRNSELDNNNDENKDMNMADNEQVKDAKEPRQTSNDEKSKKKMIPTPVRPAFSLESHYFEVQHLHHTIHGPFYPVKRAIEEFMERPEWQSIDGQRPDRRWKYLCAETFTVLAKDEIELERRVEECLYTNKHSLLSLLVPRLFTVIRIFFDTADVIPVRTAPQALKKSESESFETKAFKSSSFRHQSLPDSAIHYSDSNKETALTIKNRVCHLM